MEQAATTELPLNTTHSAILPIEASRQTEAVTITSWETNWDEWVNKYIAPGVRTQDFELIVDQLDADIFQFPLFTPTFCQDIIAYAEEQADWTVDRHRFYPTNDVLLKDIGLDEMYHKALSHFAHPIPRGKWRLQGRTWKKMQEESFIARYRTEDQQSLSIHSDFSDYTFTVGLNSEFDGGGTWFPRQQILANPKGGMCSLFPSITHPHGGRPTTGGIRYILVSFCRQTL